MERARNKVSFLKYNPWAVAKGPRVISNWLRYLTFSRSSSDVYIYYAFGDLKSIRTCCSHFTFGLAPARLASATISFFVSLRLTRVIYKCPGLPTRRKTSYFIYRSLLCIIPQFKMLANIFQNHQTGELYSHGLILSRNNRAASRLDWETVN